jgi:hypothetical protein
MSKVKFSSKIIKLGAIVISWESHLFELGERYYQDN